MKNISNINGLTVETVDSKRVVKFMGDACELVSRREALCEEDTSYNGEVLDSWETYQTPIGVVERHFWQRGAGLERSGADWRIIPVSEIEAAQKRFEGASEELSEARSALQALTRLEVA